MKCLKKWRLERTLELGGLLELNTGSLVGIKLRCMVTVMVKLMRGGLIKSKDSGLQELSPSGPVELDPSGLIKLKVNTQPNFRQENLLHLDGPIKIRLERLIKHRLYRNSCHFREGVYVKDLN